MGEKEDQRSLIVKLLMFRIPSNKCHDIGSLLSLISWVSWWRIVRWLGRKGGRSCDIRHNCLGGLWT
jgi:hypothetical protein